MPRLSVALIGLTCLLATSHARAQAPGDGPLFYKASKEVSSGFSCADLPSGAARTVPAPFDSYMHFSCDKSLGQGLIPADGFHWYVGQGIGITLSSTSAAGNADAYGRRNFPFSWYTRLVPVSLTSADEKSLRASLRREISGPPLFLNQAAINKASLLEMSAKTSNAEEKRILIVVPGTEPGLPEWFVGFECNGACFRQDTHPLKFVDRPHQ
jgi:hypothetical protein